MTKHLSIMLSIGNRVKTVLFDRAGVWSASE